MVSTASHEGSGVDSPPGGVLIVGGGLAGIVLALFLHRSGLPVRVYEAYSTLSDTAGLCLQLGPNGVAVLDALQLQPQLLERAVRGEAFRIVDEGGAEMCTVPLRAKELYGHETVMVQRHRLHTLLATTLEEEGGHVLYDHRLTAIEHLVEGTVSATFANGAVATGDVLIGCDGVHSSTRSLLFPSAPQIAFQGYLGVSCLLPTALLTDEERRVMRVDEGVLNMSRGRAGVFLCAAASVPAQGESLLLVVLKTPMPLDECNRAKDMSNAELFELLRLHFGSWHEPVPRLLGHMCAPSARPPLRWPSFSFDEELQSWHSGRAALIGDAAHASVPDGQGASLALEDAQYLSMLLVDAYGTALHSSPSEAALQAAFAQLQLERSPRAQAINEEARVRNQQLLAGPTMNPFKAWMIKGIMPWVLWFMGARMFDMKLRSAYKVPGYRIVPPRHIK